ncbi:hypothetical protein [Streptomyces sp. NPDC048349]|uniref:hypothetical protein n=1 Tax=Streptomyces sp. NPDC048349 TaxID=3155486 RepID=UPI00344A4A94
MTAQDKSRRHPRTTPSEAVGESGDREARQQADDAVVGRSGDTDAAGHEAKRQRPGIGREEQARPDPQGRRESGGTKH